MITTAMSSFLLNLSRFQLIKPCIISKETRAHTQKFSIIKNILFSVGQQFAHYQLVSRLFKRWLSSQLVLYHFDPINADLLCCYVFLHSAPFEPPKYVLYVFFNLKYRFVLFRSILTGFCRVLRLLRDFDWINEPLIINFNHELTSNRIKNK